MRCWKAPGGSSILQIAQVLAERFSTTVDISAGLARPPLH